MYILDVPPVGEISEVPLHQGMFNREATVIRFEVLLRHIRLMLGSVRQYVIPGTVLGGSGTGHGFVPVLGSLKVRVDIDDYTPVVEQSVVNDVADRETGTRHPYH